jgi:hypothetical protein
MGFRGTWTHIGEDPAEECMFLAKLCFSRTNTYDADPVTYALLSLHLGEQ